MMGYYGYRYMMPRGFGLGGVIINVLFALAVAFVIIALIRIFVGGHRRHWRENNEEVETEDGNRALDILKERYAKGEINKSEFDRIKKDIN